MKELIELLHEAVDDMDDLLNSIREDELSLTRRIAEAELLLDQVEKAMESKENLK